MAHHQFLKPLIKYRAADAVNSRLRKPTDKEESLNVHIEGMVKVLEAIGSEASIPACHKYLVKQGFNVIRIT